jgi:hypothetical protein
LRSNLRIQETFRPILSGQQPVCQILHQGKEDVVLGFDAVYNAGIDDPLTDAPRFRTSASRTSMARRGFYRGGRIVNVVYKNQEEIDRALGTGRDEYGLMTVWWD